MKKNILWIALALSATLAFTNCKKSEETPAPTTPEIAVADANGVIERFNFDGNLNGLRRTNVTFSTVNAPTLTATDRRNQANKALSVPLRGALTVDNLPLPTGNASRTISFWVHFNGNPAFQLTNERYFVCYGTQANGQAFGVKFNGQSGQIASYFDAYSWGTGNNATSNFTPSTNTGVCGWVHLAYVYNQSENKLKFYRFGVLQSDITPTSTINTTGTQLRIGLLPSATVTSFQSEAFGFDDLIIYNRALTQEEITALANDTNCS